MPNHRVIEEWMGERVETLEDLLRPGLKAVCVGINPSPVSVAAGHYYQGRAGQRFYLRLREAGLLPAAPPGREDDVAFAAGVGFTDIIKRPTRSADGLRAAEFEHGRQQLLDKLDELRPALAIFTFKATAEKLFGKFAGNGFVQKGGLAHSTVFVMPGTYENAASAKATMQQLTKYLRNRE